MWLYEKRRSIMSQQEMSYDRPESSYRYESDIGFGIPSPSSMSGQKLIPDAPGQAPTVGQRLVLALVSLGMLMGMSTLLAILATTRSTPGWMAFSLLFVLTLFTVAVVSVNAVFHRGV
jgi:hypothetical protein